MKTVDEMYGPSFFRHRKSLNWRGPIIARALLQEFEIERVLDLGCANGDIIEALRVMGVDSRGIEGATSVAPFLMCPRDRVSFCDLREELFIPRDYDLVISFEVAEHIEAEYADQYVSNLIKGSNRILMSAAVSGQGGTHHYNCQPNEYWADKLLAHRYFRDRKVERSIKYRLGPLKLKKGLLAIHQNLLYFERH